MSITRRNFLRRGALTAGGATLALTPGAAYAGPVRAGYGPLVDDPAGLLDLPRGFRYRVLQSIEDRLGNGASVPDDFDGMAAYPGPGNTTLLVRNHELSMGDATRTAVPQANPYRSGSPGGTTALLVGEDNKLVDSWVSSSGTLNNCAGGGTPWGTWVTCEEDRSTDHGYAFEVDPMDPESALSRTPITGMGFFSHEAVDIDPRTGIVYLTEDDFRGGQPAPAQEVPAGPGRTRSSFLYRFLPTDRSPRAGALQKGGTLQVMTIKEAPLFNVDSMENRNPRQQLQVVWETVNPQEPHEDALLKGGARFQRLEGCHFAGGAFWFDDTSGGDRRYGQLFRLIPSGDPSGGGQDILELYLEGESRDEMDAPDNLIVTPWGDLWIAEDGGGIQRIMGIRADGSVYEFARNRLVGVDSGGTSSEFCGPCFSPDGRTFFVNIQDPGHTFAIWGPFPRADVGRQRALASSAPRHRYAPKLSGEVREYAARHRQSPYEVAAFEALGYALA